MLRVLILYISGGTYSLKATPKYFFVLSFDVWPGVRTLALHLISQQTAY